ncbi:MAG: hypothetical protein ACKORG_01725 [Actinomycetota bacterium]
MSDEGYRGLGDIIVTARPFDEYVVMFDLTDVDLLMGRVLDCPAGASGFAAGARALGADVTAVDPEYARPHDDLVQRARRDTGYGNRYVHDNPDTYAWGFFRDEADHLARRMAALDAFDADRVAHPDRYVTGELPRLPFASGAFRLVVSSHLLFVYPDHFGYADHLRFAHELLRVATDEVRLFPLVDTTTAPWPYLERLRDDLAADGVPSDVRPVGYEFIKGGNEVLVLRPG